MSKRIFDLFVIVLSLPVTIPLTLLVALMVHFKIGSPVLFKQERPGMDREIFVMYKFRTMTNHVDDEGRLLPDNLRLTVFGRVLRRLSLDELPELLNVVKGDMSLVGPRPLLVKYLPYFTSDELARFKVRPGITGLAQVNGRNNLSWEDRFKLDIDYVSNQSLTLDIAILARTLLKVLKRDGVVDAPSEAMKDLDEERARDK